MNKNVFKELEKYMQFIYEKIIQFYQEISFYILRKKYFFLQEWMNT